MLKMIMKSRVLDVNNAIKYMFVNIKGYNFMFLSNAVFHDEVDCSVLKMFVGTWLCSLKVLPC